MIAHKKWHFLALRRPSRRKIGWKTPPARHFPLSTCHSTFIASVTAIPSFRVRLDWKFVTIKEEPRAVSACIYSHRYRCAISNHSKCCRDSARHIRVYCQMVIILFIDFAHPSLFSPPRQVTVIDQYEPQLPNPTWIVNSCRAVRCSGEGEPAVGGVSAPAINHLGCGKLRPSPGKLKTWASCICHLTAEHSRQTRHTN